MGADGRGDFGQSLRDFRHKVGLSQEELAERAAMTAKAVSALERGDRRRPYPRTVRALCDALELDEVDRAALMDAVPRQLGRADATRLARSMQPATSLVGREIELAQLASMLGSGASRLVTVIGPGGVGKTRLASAVVATWTDDAMPPIMVELAPVRAPDLVMPTIALAFGLQVGTNDPVESIVAMVGASQYLLVLDNLEHVLDIAPAIADVLARCPGLVVLATSRAPLKVRAEQAFPLGPLSLPHGRRGIDNLEESDAARMFAERARAVSPTFAVDSSNAGAIASICGRLDGLPLALELAAAHIRYLSPAQLLARLDQVVTTASWRDGPDRHQTLTSTLDWSYELLTDDERRLLIAASVFVGGFDLDALAHVSGGDPLVALEGLVEQSLVVARMGEGRDGEQRFRMLEPVRLYAMALASDDDVRMLADRHAEHFVNLCSRAHAGLRGPEQAAWLDDLGREHANLRTCLELLISSGDLRRAAEVGGNSWMYWALRGHAGEAIAWCRRVLERADSSGLDADVDDVAMAYLALAGLRLATGDISLVAAPANAAATAGARLGVGSLQGEALVYAAMAATWAGDQVTALHRLDELAELEARIDDVWVRCHMLVARAQLQMLNGELDAADDALREAEDAATNAVGPFTLATVLNVQASLANICGDDDRALAQASWATRIAAVADVVWTLVYSLPILAAQAARRRHHELAVALFAASRSTAEASLLSVGFQPDLEDAAAQIQAIRVELSEDDFRRAWEWGRSLTVDEIVDLIPSISGPPEPG